MIDTLHKIGFYCGRTGDGFWGEPQNSLSNLAFIVAASAGFLVWRAPGNRDRFGLLLIGLVAAIGIGSFLFHSHPDGLTLQFDLVPIQIYGLAAFFTLARGEFGLSFAKAVLAIIAFFLVRQGWLLLGPLLAPRGFLGGAMSHIPTIILLIGCGLALHTRQRPVGAYLLCAAGFYVAAIAARSLDVPLCQRFPFGLHWLWHCLTAATAGTVLLGLVRHRRLAMNVVQS